MKKILKLTLLLLLFAYACENGNNFEEKLPVVPEGKLGLLGVVNDNYLIDYPREMFITDSLIIVHIEDSVGMCQIFDKHTGRHLGSYFKKGQGPYELTQISSLTYNKKANILSAFDANIRKITYFNIDEIEQPVYKEIELKKIPYSNKFMVVSALGLNNGKYLTLGNTSECRLGLLKDNKEKSIENLHVSYPQIVDDKEVNQAIFSYATKWSMKPDNTKLIMSTYIGSIFEIFDFQNDRLTTYKTKYLFKPIYEVVTSAQPKWVTAKENTKCGVSTLYATDNNIFCVLEGAIDNNTGPELNSIFSLDWEGNFVKEYKFPKGVFPQSFAVDDENKILYCIIMNINGEYSFNKYSL